MKYSVPVRILGGFLTLTLLFTATGGYTVYRMYRVRDQLTLISSCYMPLTLILGELYAVQRGLIDVAADAAITSAGATRTAKRQVHLARRFRKQASARALNVVAGYDIHEKWPRGEEQRIHTIGQDLSRIRQAIFASDQHFQLGNNGDNGAEGPGEPIDLSGERRLASSIRALRLALRAHVKNAGDAIAAEQRENVWIGLGLIGLALLISLLFSLRARTTLRPLRGLVAGTKRLTQGDYSKRIRVESSDEIGILAKEFNMMAAAIEEREQQLMRSEGLAAAGRIAAHITHEVRNPLNAISLTTEMLDEELIDESGKAAQAARELCATIRREVDRLTAITEEYLMFARPAKLSPQHESLSAIVEDLIAFLEQELVANQVTCTTELAADLPPVYADEAKLRQALLNLLRNAIEAFPRQNQPEAVPITRVISVTTCRQETGAVVRIRDTGSGISSNELPRIFEPFFSTKSRGTGLGLALSEGIVREHGGSLSVTSEEGRGSTFTIHLPILAPQPGRSQINVPDC